MTDWRLRLARLVATIGVISFLACWAILWATESRVFSDPIYSAKGPTRTVPVPVKGDIYFLEAPYASLFSISQHLILISFAVAVLAGAYQQIRKRKDKELELRRLGEKDRLASTADDDEN